MELTELHGPDRDPRDSARFCDEDGCTTASEVAGLSTRTEASEVCRRAKLRRRSILPGGLDHEESTDGANDDLCN